MGRGGPPNEGKTTNLDLKKGDLKKGKYKREKKNCLYCHTLGGGGNNFSQANLPQREAPQIEVVLKMNNWGWRGTNSKKKGKVWKVGGWGQSVEGCRRWRVTSDVEYSML